MIFDEQGVACSMNIVKVNKTENSVRSKTRMAVSVVIVLAASQQRQETTKKVLLFPEHVLYRLQEFLPTPPPPRFPSFS